MKVYTKALIIRKIYLTNYGESFWRLAMERTERDFIDIIGGTYKDAKTKVEQLLGLYAYRQEVNVVKKLLYSKNSLISKRVVDLGCSIGSWFEDYKRMGFSEIIGVDISRERLEEASKKGYDKTYCCNASNLPLDSDSELCMISNDMFVHVLQDNDKLKIFQEVRRVLAPNGIFIFNFASAKGCGYNGDTTREYCRFNRLGTILELLRKANLKVERVIPAYFMIPRIGANARLASLSSSLLYPFTDKLLRVFGSVEKAKVVYVSVTK